VSENKVNIKNKQAYFEYNIIEKFVAGIMLTGTEIKSIRQSKASIKEAYCVVVKEEVFIRNMTINEYEKGGHYNHEPKRDRKLLLNRKEISKLSKGIEQKGFTIVPLHLFLSEKGLAKIEIALAQGKKLHDKRDSLKEKDVKRELDRIKKDF
jgi:SsrA-binding protein